MNPWLFFASMAVLASLLACVIPRTGNFIFRLVFKKDLPSSYPVSISLVISAALVVFAVFMLLKVRPFTMFLVSQVLMFLTAAVGLFVFSLMIIKGRIHLEIWRPGICRQKYRIVMPEEYRRKATFMFVGYVCSLFLLMVLSVVFASV